MRNMTQRDDWRRGSWLWLEDRARARRRWQRRISAALPIAAVGVLVFSLVVAAGGSGAAAGSGGARASLASLLLPSGSVGSTAHHSARTTSAVSYGAASRQQPSSAIAQHARHAERYREASSADLALVPTRQVVAHLEHTTKGYPGPHALGSNRKVPGSWYGYPSVLPVLAETRDRLKVRLAQRPNESTTWIKRGAAVLTVTHWAILVNTSQHWLYVFHHGIQQDAFPVGNGTSRTPTPSGTYFLAFHAPPNGPGYGSVMLETSAHSNVYRTFDGGDDAIIAIHGPVGSDAQIGNHGAAISNGCIRMHNWDLKQVKHVPNGAPVILTS
jgi:lipoprotein-anchoring transpeptidase ErfK/SrfK